MPNALVTGANRGIGLELCRLLKDQGYQVTAVCRQSSEELNNLGVQVLCDIDVGNDDSLKQLRRSLTSTKLDVVINNAGILQTEKWPEVDFESLESQFRINSLGPLKVTQALSDCLDKGSKVVMVSSQMGSTEDNSSGGYYGYRMSKAALNAGAKSLAIDVKAKGIGVFIFHPGYVQTRMTGGQGNLTPVEAASGILKTLSKLDMSNTGTFWTSRGDKLPW